MTAEICVCAYSVKGRIEMTPVDFLVDTLGQNPQILQALYGDDEDTADLQQDAVNANRWVVKTSRKATRDDCWPRDNYFGYYAYGLTPNQYGEPTAWTPYQNVAQIHYCVFDDEMSDLGFLVLEMKDGGFLLGSHVDAWE